MSTSQVHARLVCVAQASCLALALALVSCSRSDPLEYAEEETEFGKHWTGTKKDGVKHGRWTAVRDGRIVEIEHWHEGVRHGPFRRWSYEGIYLDGHYHKGVHHGRFRLFDSTDPPQLAALEWYHHGQKVRTWCGWDISGKLEYIREYQFDKLVHEEENPPGECPVIFGQGARHLDPDDLDFR